MRLERSASSSSQSKSLFALFGEFAEQFASAVGQMQTELLKLSGSDYQRVKIDTSVFVQALAEMEQMHMIQSGNQMMLSFSERLRQVQAPVEKVEVKKAETHAVLVQE